MISVLTVESEKWEKNQNVLEEILNPSINNIFNAIVNIRKYKSNIIKILEKDFKDFAAKLNECNNYYDLIKTLYTNTELSYDLYKKYLPFLQEYYNSFVHNLIIYNIYDIYGYNPSNLNEYSSYDKFINWKLKFLYMYLK
jgi:hypothetical protein